MRYARMGPLSGSRERRTGPLASSWCLGETQDPGYSGASSGHADRICIGTAYMLRGITLASLA